MTYAEHRKIIDTDSHLIELEDFLYNAASPAHKDLIPSMLAQKHLPINQERLDQARQLFAKRTQNQEAMAKFEASLLDNRRDGLSRLGAFDREERSHTLDLFGFELQWILPTYTFHQVAHLEDPDSLEAGVVTLNRAMGQFCAADQRMRAIGYLPLRLGVNRALAIMQQGLQDGCYSFMVDTNQPNDKAYSFTHPLYDPIWAEFAERNAPVALHVAANGDYRPVPRSFSNNGRPEIHLGGDAPAGELGVLTIGNSVQVFLAAMIFDGVFERHPNLVAISMEHAASWLPSWLQSLDFTAGMFKRARQYHEAPSETAKRHIKVSPFAGEPIGWIIENSSPDMLVFASDYPHPEGGADPIAKFEATMSTCDETTLNKFYYDNMAAAMGLTGR
jgi:predicted TIM-barrel fold metal-dependent hydrolase